MVKIKTQQNLQKNLNEMILVVKRDLLFPQDAFQGLNQESIDTFEAIVKNHMEFQPRSVAEEDPTYKQIIPYLIFHHKHRYFLMQRKATASETRLQNKYSLGIGGHIRKDDISDSSVVNWAKREFHEEINYEGKLDIKPFGILNDDSNAVGKVHLGFVFLLEGDSDDISIKSELKSGQLKNLQECAKIYENLESWSQIVFNALKNQK